MDNAIILTVFFIEGSPKDMAKTILYIFRKKIVKLTVKIMQIVQYILGKSLFTLIVIKLD